MQKRYYTIDGDLLLFSGQLVSKILLNSYFRYGKHIGQFRNAVVSKMKLFRKKSCSWNSLTNVRKTYILDVIGVLDLPLVYLSR